MTDSRSMSTEAPAKPSWIDSLSPEDRAAHLAKMKAGREAAAAKKAAKAAKVAASDTPAPSDKQVAVLGAAVVGPQPGPVTDAVILAELQQLRDDNARMKKQLGGYTPEEIAALPTEDVFYDFVADQRTERDEPIGEKIRDLKDPRWAELIKMKMSIRGSVVVMTINRAKTGEETGRTERNCIPARTPQMALSMMQARATNPSGQWY